MDPVSDTEDTNVTPSHNAALTVRCTFYSTGTSGKKKTEKKDVKTKELPFVFSATQKNYVDLLNTILTKFGIMNRKATAKRVYRVKIQILPAKQSEACDIEDYAEYQEATSKIVETKSHRNHIVFVDMKDIEKSLKKDGDDAHGEAKRTLGHFRIILKRRWKNDHDGGFTFVDPFTGFSMALTPQAMKEWARAMVRYDGNAKVSEPPRTQTFDPLYRHDNNSNNTDGLTVLSNMLNTISTIARGPGSISPKARSHAGPPSTPPVNSPTKLRRFLAHAEEKLGVANAKAYEEQFSREGLGPDILDSVDSQDLRQMGLTTSDVIRLKKGAPLWWNGPDAKRKATDDATPSAGPMPPTKKVCFEKCYLDGSGARTLFGPRLERIDDPLDLPESPGYVWYYLCEARNEFVPVPEGFIPVIDGEEF
ncbi:uncharacterized protein EV420DRAFT_1317888 [Desarmillaria tabescens]|uniref:SAM domain-containing protein n=1 Tax=Armillaria tabescens TaxID=1929756 RepID=A0AA39MIN1_ARMTA|nr:uncharacterized protein EV420DRAFT_1317888 [Desarmillaria tabescens]KAK0435228.1 hypothetical protein EV420DRAFT_1317888 [Desarmillaria tabescens]